MAEQNSVISTIKPYLVWARRIFTPIAIAFLLYFAWHSRTLLAGQVQSSEFSWLILSTALWILSHFMSPVFTFMVLKGFSIPLAYNKAFNIHASRLPAKYLPGGIWHSAARASDYYRQGISVRNVGIYLLLENIVIAAITLLIGGSVVASIDGTGQTWATMAFICAVLGGVAIIISPIILNKYFLPDEISLNPLEYTKSIGVIAVYWLIVAGAFICFLQGFPDLNLKVSSVEIGGIYIFSWAIGFITLFAPQGVGVTEFVASQLLEGGIATSSFIVLLAGFRLVILVADLLTWMISFIFSADGQNKAYRVL